ncbi:hypothetical protein BVX94_01050 [bacterium B17]|nr:hypothetical protein BVX94_01050 [bacterium B17]
MNVGLMVSGLGLFFVAWYSVMFAMPGKAIELLKKFPRDRASGIVLTALTILWAAILLYKMPLGWFDNYKQSLYLLGPLTFFLVVKFMDELLAPRALGALFLLIPAPILHGIRFHESPLRLVIVVLCYIMIVKGLVFVMSPYQFRKRVERFVTTDKACKAFGIAGILVGVFLLATGIVVFGGIS